MKVLLFGNTAAAVAVLDELGAAGHEVAVVATPPTRAHCWHASLAAAARERGLEEIALPDDVNAPAFVGWARARAPDLILAVNYDQRLGSALLDLPKLGAFNLHPSLLPAYRGVAPLIRAVAAGEREVGVTLHEMVHAFDAGDILLQARLTVGERETGFQLHQRAASVARQLISAFLRDPAACIAGKTPQRGPKSYFGKRAPRLNLIDWRDSAHRIVDIVRALTEPLPCAHTYAGRERVLLLEAALADEPAAAPPGTPRLTATGEVQIAAGTGAVRLLRVRHAGIELRADRDREPLARLFALPPDHVPAAVGEPPTRLDHFVYFGTPVFDREEEDALVATLRSGWIGTGEQALAFEQALASYLGVPRCLALSSATAGLFLALKTLPLVPGDEVITTPLTFAATANVVEQLGGRVVFADIDPATLNLDPAAVERAITPRTRVLLPVHFGGLSCDMTRLEAIARAHGLVILEDAAHALGGRHEGRPIGGRGNLSAFSFYANKSITTGEGGMLAAIPEASLERVKRLRLHGLSSDALQRFRSKGLILSQVVEPGYKMNLTDLQAALGLTQLAKLPRFISRKQAIADIYDHHFAAVPAVRRQARPAPSTDACHALHLYALVLDLAQLALSRNEVVAELRRRNVGAGIHYEALYLHPYYRERYGYRPAAFPIATATSAGILSLPISPSLTDDEAHAIAATVTDLLRECHR